MGKKKETVFCVVGYYLSSASGQGGMMFAVFDRTVRFGSCFNIGPDRLMGDLQWVNCWRARFIDKLAQHQAFKVLQDIIKLLDVLIRFDVGEKLADWPFEAAVKRTA
jgi:hypothetical protein